MCEAVSREHDLWVVTRKNNRNDIEAALRDQPNPNVHFHYTDLPRWACFWKKGERGIKLYYYLWQFAMLRLARQLQRSVRFDVAHHVTFVNDYCFTGLALLGLPSVWGPIGSPGNSWSTIAGTKGWALFEQARHVFRAACRSLDPLFWLSAVRAKLVIGITAEVGQKFPLRLLARGKMIYHTAIGVEAALTVPDTDHLAREGLEVAKHGSADLY